ncbi:Condensin complex subunit 3, partial [Pseudolycoriella hygida]
MPRKRKCVQQEKDLHFEEQLDKKRKKIMKVLLDAQINEVYHRKYASELRQLYENMEHEHFTSVFINCTKQLMQGDMNEFKNRGLKFMAEFVSTFQSEDMHSLFDSMFMWIFKTVSLNVNVRLRLCEFVNRMLNALPADGDIEEYHCTEILSYMFDRLKDTSPYVRVEAIKALCRLQMKDDPEDAVTKIFLFHLEHDPNPMVRRAVISSIARSNHTVPYIMGRLSDVDERVRRSIFAHMSNFAFNRYSIEQRVTLLERGLNDSSVNVRNITLNIMLKNWLASCKNCIMSLLSSLKLDGNESVMRQFRSVARMSLLSIFRSQDPNNLIKVLPLIEDDSQNFHKCPHLDKLTIELSVFWVSLIEFLQSDDSKCEYLEHIVPDITAYCNYIVTLGIQIKFNQRDNFICQQSILLTLLELLQRLDLSDEIGHQSVKGLVVYLLAHVPCDENIIKCLVKICELLMPESDTRLEFYVETVKKVIHPIEVNANFVTSQMNAYTEMQVNSLQSKLSELKQKVACFMDIDEDEELAATHEEIAFLKEKITFFIIPYISVETTTTNLQSVKSILPALMFFHHGICSAKVKQLIPSTYQLYEDVIRQHVDSTDVTVKNWALKCTGTFGLFNKQIAIDSYCKFCNELLTHEIKSIWVTTIATIFQFICRYGLDSFASRGAPHNQNANESLENDHQNLSDNDGYVSGDDIVQLFKKCLISNDDADITCELVDGFAILTLHRRFFDAEVMSKLVIIYFSANLPPKVTQILSIFFETLIRCNKQKYLQMCLYETMSTISSDESFDELSFNVVLKFFVNSTAENTMQSNQQERHLHDHVAATFLTWMINNSAKHKLLKATTKEMLQLKLSENEESRLHLLELVNRLQQETLRKETEQNLNSFKMKIQRNDSEGGPESVENEVESGADEMESGADEIESNADEIECGAYEMPSDADEMKCGEGEVESGVGEVESNVDACSQTGKENEHLPKRLRLDEGNSFQRSPLRRLRSNKNRENNSK